MLQIFLGVLSLVGVIIGGEWTKCPNNCTADYALSDYNVSLLPLEGTWPAVYYHGSDTENIHSIPTFFNFSLCSPLTSYNCFGDHICYTSDFNSFYSLGAHNSCYYKDEDRVLTLTYAFGSSAVNQFGIGNVTVTLVCGSSVGVPEVIEGDPHGFTVEILWVTSSVCKRDSRSNMQDETRCYLVNHSFQNGLQASFIDLSGLIQKTGFVATSLDRPKLLFNVSICRPIVGGLCDGSMVCLYSSDSQLSKKWKPHTPLAKISRKSHLWDDATPHYEGSNVVVSYPITAVKQNVCQSIPYVKIKFICPTGDEDIGLTVEFIDDQLCQVNFIWVTMHACDVKSVQSSTCSLRTPFGVAFDLNNLPEQTVTSPTNKYIYDLKLCKNEGLNTKCGRTDDTSIIHSTQTDVHSGACVVIGKGNGKLRYADNSLNLVYTLGDTCHNGMARTTIITFVCTSHVTNNCTDNCLSFITENHCIYEFEWITSLACNSISTSNCKFLVGNVNYDFGALTAGNSGTYAVMSSSDFSVCYLIKPCGLLEVTNEIYTPSQYCNERKAPLNCSGSSICQIKKFGNPIGIPLGVFSLHDATTLGTIDYSVISVSTLPLFNGKSAQIQYVCQVGTLLTTPVYIGHLTSNITEFHWYTYAACPQKLIIGSNCVVTEPTTGFKFDLSPLASQTYHFNDSTNKYVYHIQMCSQLPVQYGCGNNSGICQKTVDHSFSAGQPSSRLIYENSNLKLVFANGSSCSDGSKRETTVVFFCDTMASVAVVQKVYEVRHCNYLVEMKTKLACPPAYQSNECVFFSANGANFDLFELGRSIGNWEAQSSDGSVYLINVCRPLNLQGIGHCNPLSSVCRITGSTVQNLGYASSSRLHLPTNHSIDTHVDLVLTYSFKSSNALCSKVTTDIEFICNHNVSADNAPQHVSGGGTANPCHFIFRWVTRVACPVINELTKNCEITDRSSAYTFNLEPLKAHKAVYNINGTNTQFSLAICGTLNKNDTHCKATGIAGCQVDSHWHSHSIGTYASMLLEYKDESIILTYDEGDNCSTGPRKTEIDFICNRNLKYEYDEYFGAPELVREVHHCHYLFLWHTALACLPVTLECVADGGTYDLRSLMKKKNWIIHSSYGEIVLSVCQPVSDQRCNATFGVGACLLSNHSRITTVLGYVTGDLVVLNDKTIQLSYHNGFKCSTSGSRTVTVINFRCNSNVEEGEPILISGVDQCHVEFDWETKYACPVTVTSSQWTVTNPETGQVYNLTQLKPVLSATIKDSATNTIYKYTVGLAGQTIHCGDNINVTVCQIAVKNNETFVLARASPMSLVFQDGKVHIEYENGDNCNNLHKRHKIVIYFEYDPRPDFLEVLPEEECEHSLIVYTKLVYEKSINTAITCSLADFPNIGWFSSHLHLPLTVHGTKLYFSVCSPISADNQLTSGYTQCSPIAGACLVVGSKSINLGRPSSHHPLLVAHNNSEVIVTYVGGDICNGSISYTTKIILVCSSAFEDGVPTLSFPICHGSQCLINSCEFVIVWPSRHACRFAIPSADVGCLLQDPYDGSTFDLRQLSNGSYITDVSEHFIIGLCGAISKPPPGCLGENIGICHYKDNNWIPIAYADHKISLVSHSPHVLDVVYSSGTTCEGGSKWTVIIRVRCSSADDFSRPKLQSTRGCEISFDWPTSALCIGQVEGCFHMNSTYNLESLIFQSWQGNYLNTQNEKIGIFNISICRNLNPTIGEGFHCFPGPSGICLQPDITNTSSYLNLGHMTTTPVIEKNKIVLNYTEGEKCVNTNGLHSNVITTVTLLCPSKSEEGPQLEKLNDCHYSLHWMTFVACLHHDEESKSCVLSDPLSETNYNFNSLAKTISFQDSGVSYSVCICPSYTCSRDGSQIINETANIKLGNFVKMAVFPDSGPEVVFQNGDICDGSGTRYSSTIFMRCHRGYSAEEKGKFVFENGLSTVPCLKFFSWWTPLACPTAEVVCTIQSPYTKFFYDFHQLHATDGFWEISNGSVTYLINICGPIYGSNRTKCSGNAAVCMVKGNIYQDLGYLDTQFITFNGNHNPEIHFHGPKQSPSSQSFSVIIELTCGIRGLHIQKQEGTVYSFEWSTTLACADTNNLHKQNSCSSYIGNSVFSYNLNDMKLSQTVHNGMYTYIVDICNKSNKCGHGMSVCKTGGGRKLDLSSTSKTIFLDSYWMQVLTVGVDGSATITVECVNTLGNLNYHFNEMRLENSYTDQHGKLKVFFKMFTQQGCHIISTPHGTKPTVISKVSHSNKPLIIAVIVLSVTFVCVAAIVVLLLKKEKRHYIFQKLHLMTRQKSNDPVRYIKSKVNQSLLEDLSSESGSDEDMVQETCLNDNKRCVKEGKPVVASIQVETMEQVSDEELINI